MPASIVAAYAFKLGVLFPQVAQPQLLAAADAAEILRVLYEDRHKGDRKDRGARPIAGRRAVYTGQITDMETVETAI